MSIKRLLNQVFFEVPDAVFDLTTGTVGIKKGGNIVTASVTTNDEDGKSTIEVMHNVLSEFGMSIPAFGIKVPLSEVPYDEWGGFQVARTIEDAGYDTVKIPKNVKTFSPAMRELEAALKSGRFQHDGNPILAWMVGNTVAREDANGNVFPRKETNAKKIDGLVALLMGISRAMVLAGTEVGDDGFYDNPIMVGI